MPRTLSETYLAYSFRQDDDFIGTSLGFSLSCRPGYQTGMNDVSCKIKNARNSHLQRPNDERPDMELPARRQRDVVSVVLK